MSATSVKSANEAITRAQQAINASDRNLQLAAEYLQFAVDEGVSQREIAERVGRSVGWVNTLLQWRRDGFKTEYPFAEASRSSRERAEKRVHSNERRRKRSSRLSQNDRRVLVKLLGMLGSQHEGEVANAARKIEELRRRVDFMWDDVIIAAAA
jgi:transposase